MSKLIHRVALALCAAVALGFGATVPANAADLGVHRAHRHHWHRSGCGFWPDMRCYYGIPAYPYSAKHRCGRVTRDGDVADRRGCRVG